MRIINPSQYRSFCACLGFCCATRWVNLVRVLLIKSLNVQEIEKKEEEQQQKRWSWHYRNWIPSASDSGYDNIFTSQQYSINLNVWNSLTLLLNKLFFDITKSVNTLRCIQEHCAHFSATSTFNFQLNYTFIHYIMANSRKPVANDFSM